MVKGREKRKIRERISPRAGFSLAEILVVITVIGILIAVISSIIGNIAFLQTANDETQLLRDALLFSRSAAIKSNQTVYFEFDLDKNSYQSYRIKRSEGKIERDYLLKKKELAASNSIVAIALASGTRITSGKIGIPFSPEGIAEEMAIYIGTESEIKFTLLYSRYGHNVRIAKGEEEHKLTDDNWYEDIEKRD